MAISMAKVGHPHLCVTCQKEWMHRVYSCDANADKLCPDHEPKP